MTDLPFGRFRCFRPTDLPRDLIAGLTLAAIGVPEQMATAQLGDFSPQIGFFAFAAGSVGFAIFGSNRFLSCGADSTITPIFAGGMALMAASGSSDYQALAAALALMVGAVLIAGSLFRLGWIADLLSIPVTIGFLPASPSTSWSRNCLRCSGWPHPRARCSTGLLFLRTMLVKPTFTRSASDLAYCSSLPDLKP